MQVRSFFVAKLEPAGPLSPILAAHLTPGDRHLMMKPTERSQTNPAELELPSGTVIYPRLPHAVIVRAPGLLPMLYTPRELEQELHLPARTIREWLGKGLPHQRDERGHIWINGRQLAAWVKTACQRRSHQPLDEDEAYCLHCRRPVTLLNPTETYRGRQALTRSTCAACGHTIYRARRHDQPA